MQPVYLELNNFNSHRKSYVDFNNFDYAVIIGNIDGDYNRNNGSGKTSIFSAILWALFNKSTTAVMDDIIFWGEEECSVIFTFYQDNILYKIKRTRTRSNGLSTVSFEYLVDEEWADLSGSTSGLTNDKIISIVKFDYKTFINSAYFMQSDISEFTNADPAKKKEILKSIVDISKWDNYEKEAKSKLKTINTEVATYQSMIKEAEESEIELIKIQAGLNSLNADLKNFAESKKIKNEHLEHLIIKYQTIKSGLDTQTWDKILLENKTFLTKSNELEKELTFNKNSLIEQKANLVTKTQLLEKLQEDQRLLITDYSIDDKIKLTSDTLLDFKSKSLNYKNTVENLSKTKDVLKAGSCYVCQQDITENIYTALLDKHNHTIDQAIKDKIYADNKILELEKLSNHYYKIQKNNQEFNNLKLKIATQKQDVAILNENIAQLISKIETLESTLQGYKDKISSNLLVLESLKNKDFQSLQKEITETKKIIDEYENILLIKNRQIGTLFEKEKILNIKIEKFKNDKKVLFSLNKKQVTFEKLVKLLGKNGIQAILLNAIIDDLEVTANDILYSICNEPIKISLETQRVGSDGISVVDTLDLKVNKDGINQNFKSLSGGEKFRVSLALRIALSEISSRHNGSSLEFLLLDEINSPLDRHGTDNLFTNIIQNLSKKYKILVITHDDSLKEKFNNVLDVTKINGESTINMYSK